MKRAALLMIMALAGCKKVENSPQAEAAKDGPPPPPPYQVRADLPAGDRLTSGRSGEALFSNRCGYCHLAGGMGTNLLTKQMMMAKRPPSDGLLTNRTDLTSDYVTSVVRMGKGAMPRQTKVDITDAELASVAAYLGKAGK